jgi:hypothetical protein
LKGNQPSVDTGISLSGNVSASNGLQQNRAGIQFLQAEPFDAIVLMLPQKDFGGTNLNSNLFSTVL